MHLEKFFAKSNLYTKRLWPLNQGPMTNVLIKKNREGRKSRDTVILRYGKWLIPATRNTRGVLTEDSAMRVNPELEDGLAQGTDNH
jgi:hypothetical protein